MKDRSFSAGCVRILRVVVLVISFLTVVLPLYWMFITSIKTNAEVLDLQNITYIPHTIITSNYKDLFTLMSYGTYLKNSIILSLSSAVLNTIFSILGGYALARYDFKGKKSMVLFVLVSQMIPSILILIPMYSFFAKAGLIARSPHTALFIYYVISGIPFCMIMIRSFFESIPYSLEESAMLDGCSRLQCLLKIVLPVVLPGVVAVFCFAFINSWNDLLGGIIFTSQPGAWTIPVGLKSLIGKNNVPWGLLMSGGIMALIPTGIMFMIVQKYIVAGLTAGAVKE